MRSIMPMPVSRYPAAVAQGFAVREDTGKTIATINKSAVNERALSILAILTITSLYPLPCDLKRCPRLYGRVYVSLCAHSCWQALLPCGRHL